MEERKMNGKEGRKERNKQKIKRERKKQKINNARNRIEEKGGGCMQV